MKNENIKIKIEKGFTLTQEQSRLISLFSEYCYRALQLKDSYLIFLVKNKEKYKIKTTAVCFMNDKKILIFSKDRLLADVLRSIGHEMTHLRQHEAGEYPTTEYLHFSSELEDSANKLAGKLLNSFASVMGEKSIYEEYLKSD